MVDPTNTFVFDKAKVIETLVGFDTANPFPVSITPVDGGGKFSPTGETLPHPGNTFLCHIDRTSKFFAGLEAYQADFKASEFAPYFAFLSPSSFHMTIFCGVSGVPLGVDGWPANYARDASLDEITEYFARRASDWQGATSLRGACKGLQKPVTIAMSPASSFDRDALWDARSRLQEITGIRRTDFADYVFHVGLGYQLGWLTSVQAEEVTALSARLYDRHLADIGSIELAAIEFCRFETMQHFDPIMRLSNRQADAVRTRVTDAGYYYG